MFAGLLAAAFIKWRVLRESRKTDLETSLNDSKEIDYESSLEEIQKKMSEFLLDFKKRDAFAWWGFFSLTFGGMLIPIFEKKSPILYRYLALENSLQFFSNPIANTLFVIFFSIGGLIMASHTEKLSGQWMVNPSWPFNTFMIFTYIVFPWMIFQNFLKKTIQKSIFLLPLFLILSYLFFIAIFGGMVGISEYILISSYISLFLLSIGFIKLRSGKSYTLKR